MTTRVILDTDMFGDYDDVGAMAVLHALADAGECELVAVGCNTWGEGNMSVAECEIVNAYYGRSDIEVGTTHSGGRQGVGEKGHSIIEKYPQWIKHPRSADAPLAVEVYRRALEASPDGSVVLCSIGHLNIIADFLRTDRELVERKIRLWVCMACSYPNGKEYNSQTDWKASDYAFANWPKTIPIVWTDFQYGCTCYAGRKVAELPDDGNPVRDVFAHMLTPREKVVPGKSWDQLRGHPSWDETAALIAVRGWEKYFTLQRGYYKMVGEEGDDLWTDDPISINGRVDVKPDFSRDDVADVIDELMCRRPKRS